MACLEPFSPPYAHLTLEDGQSLCPDCRARLPRLKGGYCPFCGEIVKSFQSLDSLPIAPCGSCLSSAPPWQEFRFYGTFESLLRDLLLRAKYQGDPAALKLIGQLLEKACFDLPAPDAIIPMPLHPARLRQRGFNQCLEIARPLARHWHVPLRLAWLQRQRHTPPQTGLSRSERRANLNNVFLASPEVAKRHILLIDDTATTGTSLRRATEALLLAGAASVNAAVIARTARHAKT